jgi:hypothetical protein
VALTFDSDFIIDLLPNKLVAENVRFERMPSEETEGIAEPFRGFRGRLAAEHGVLQA